MVSFESFTIKIKVTDPVKEDNTYKKAALVWAA